VYAAVNGGLYPRSKARLDTESSCRATGLTEATDRVAGQAGMRLQGYKDREIPLRWTIFDAATNQPMGADAPSSRDRRTNRRRS
jgi:hypothetical protein